MLRIGFTQINSLSYSSEGMRAENSLKNFYSVINRLVYWIF
jgi:hypothetical protein